MSQQLIRKKINDTFAPISGGRAERYWSGRLVRRSTRYNSGQSTGGDIDQYQLLRKYQLKGFEYGNWVNNNDRYDRLMATRDSLNDLARIIGTTNIGLQGTLGIAFGARGMSKARAHFEPSTFMINLTKENGHGSLAHEYGHAIDYFFGMYVDQHRAYSALSGGSSTARTLKENQVGGLRRLMNRVVDTATTADDGRPSPSYERWQQRLGDTNGYWFRRTEIFARCFEQWVGHQCRRKKIQNTFLCKSTYDTSVYLLEKDFKRMLPHMDKLIAAMATMLNSKA